MPEGRAHMCQMAGGMVILGDREGRHPHDDLLAPFGRWLLPSEDR